MILQQRMHEEPSLSEASVPDFFKFCLFGFFRLNLLLVISTVIIL